ncbi:hypothetical protein CFP56_042984 [Quercus suber]|uniref:Secreted protein n=1 Tax=Quercus suber TaxID=58331 RepID=A0AAW0ISL4_QUESU
MRFTTSLPNPTWLSHSRSQITLLMLLPLGPSISSKLFDPILPPLGATIFSTTKLDRLKCSARVKSFEPGYTAKLRANRVLRAIGSGFA